MTAIVYLHHIPEHDDAGALLPAPPHVLKWTGWYDGQQDPITFGVVPYLINTSDMQVALRTIAPRLHEVVSLHMIAPKSRAHISRLVMHADRLPMTYIATRFEPFTKPFRAFRGTATTIGGIDVVTEGGGTVLMASQVERLQRYPFDKCVDQMASHYVQDVIDRRKSGERGLKFAKPANEWASIATVHPDTLARVLRDHYEPDRTGPEYPLTALNSIKIVKLPPQAKPQELPAEPQPRERCAAVAQPAPPARPTDTAIPGHDDDDNPRGRRRVDIYG